jgi:hypothetical protein
VSRQHAFLEAGVNLIEVDAIGHGECTLKRTKTALANIVLLFFLLLLLLLSFDRQHAVGNLHLDIFIIHSWQFGYDFIGPIGE